jgi:hypothetical protein
MDKPWTAIARQLPYTNCRGTFASQLPQIPISSLVYGGTEKQKRSDVLIWRDSDVVEMMAKIN